MKRTCALGFAMAAAVMLACAGAGSASAATRCAVVWSAGTGVYKDAACTTFGGTKEYVKVFTGGKKLKGREECAVVAEAGSGTYSDANCTSAGGSKEYIKVVATPLGKVLLSDGGPPVNVPATGSSSVSALLEVVGGSKVTCTATKLKGELENSTTGTATFTFTGCMSAGLKCKTTSGSAGEIVFPTTLLVEALSEKDYLDLEVAELDIKCSTVDIKVKGELLVPATPEFTLNNTYTFNAEGAKGVQKPVDPITRHLEANFAAKGFEHASLQQTEVKTTFSEEIEFV